MLILIPGLFFSFVGLAIFAVVRGITPERTPDVGEMIESPGTYIPMHLPYVMGWAAAIIAKGCALGYVSGRMVTALQENRSRISKSSWAFWLESKEFPTHVECHLTDGSVVTGYLVSYNAGHEETPDRDLSLLRPRHLPAHDSEQLWSWDDSGGIAVISASRIQFLIITHPRFEPSKHEPTQVPPPAT